MLDDWQWWIFESLPFAYALNIVDSFLLEGPKVLYRFGIAILESFYRHSVTAAANASASTSISCSPSGRRHQHVNEGLGVDCVNRFCRSIPVPFDRLLKVAFGFRNMSRKDIENVFQTEEKLIKKARAKSNNEARFR